MNRVAITRRINLGSYEHYEIFVEIQRSDATEAMIQAAELINRGLKSLDVGDRIDLRKLKEQ